MTFFGPPPLPRDTPQLRALCRKLAPHGELQLVPVVPAPDATVNDCFPNVERMVEREGGTCEYGWQFWESFPGMLLEAEFHAVWVDSTGNRRDITPKGGDITTIAYLPDPARKYDGRQVDSVRVALSRDPLVKALIAAYRARYREWNRGDLARQYGSLDTPEIRAALRRVADLERLVAQRSMRNL